MSCTQAKACGYHQNGITTQSLYEKGRLLIFKNKKSHREPPMALGNKKAMGPIESPMAFYPIRDKPYG